MAATKNNFVQYFLIVLIVATTIGLLWCYYDKKGTAIEQEIKSAAIKSDTLIIGEDTILFTRTDSSKSKKDSLK